MNKKLKTKRFIIAEACETCLDRVIALIAIEVEDEDCYFLVESYFDGDQMKIIDPEYYNPFKTTVCADSRSAHEHLKREIKRFGNYWEPGEVEIR